MYTTLLFIKEFSERLPNKNFLDFGGKPLYRSIIDKLLNFNDTDQIIINTDSEKILDQLAGLNKIQLQRRSKELCGNDKVANDLIMEMIPAAKNENILQTHVTNPLLTLNVIKKAILFYEKNGRKRSLFSVTRCLKRYYSENCEPLNHDPRKLRMLQNVKPIFEENSCIYLFSKSLFYKYRNRLCYDPLLFEIPTVDAVDIDTEIEYKLAKQYL